MRVNVGAAHDVSVMGGAVEQQQHGGGEQRDQRRGGERLAQHATDAADAKGPLEEVLCLHIAFEKN